MKLEMRTVQKIAAAAMTLAVMFGCASPLKPLAASAAQNTVSVSADIDEETPTSAHRIRCTRRIS